MTTQNKVITARQFAEQLKHHMHGYGENPSENRYQVGRICTNCSHSNTFYILKGVPIDGLYSTCDNCECDVCVDGLHMFRNLAQARLL